MPITNIQRLPIGNALRLFLSPPSTAVSWRVLRNTTGDFSGYDDPSAFLISNGRERVVLDIDALSNGTTYFYSLYALDAAGVWSPSGAVLSEHPSADFIQLGVDPLELVRQRIDLGLRVLIDRGELSPVSGRIEVLDSPPNVDAVDWPVVTVHCTQDSSGDRALGDEVPPPERDPAGGVWTSYEGWISRVQLNCIVWSLNPDERRKLRKFVKDIIIANLAVFDAKGLQQLELTQTDVEDFQSFDAPVYQVVSTVTGVSLSYVAGIDNAIASVSMDVKF